MVGRRHGLVRIHAIFLAPLGLFSVAFLVIPLAELVLVAGSGPRGAGAYLAIVTDARYRESLLSTLGLATLTTLTTLVLGTIVAQSLGGRRFPGRDLLRGLLTFPLAFPGVVIGFLVILIGGRLGLVGSLTQATIGNKVVFAYSIVGLFVGYLYFSIPRVILTLIAAFDQVLAGPEHRAPSRRRTPRAS